MIRNGLYLRFNEWWSNKISTYLYELCLKYTNNFITYALINRTQKSIELIDHGSGTAE